MGASIRGSGPARFLSLLAAGTLAQRVTVTLGIGVACFALFQALPWFALAGLGFALCWMALRDFERMQDR